MRPTTDQSTAIETILSWLDSHISYERTGPGGKSPEHDPASRLRTMQALVDAIGEPHRNGQFIHVTGTNGKTTTCRIVTDLLIAQGLSAGTYTSPHLQSLNERIMLNGLPISDDDLADALQAVRLCEPLLHDVSASYFEILTAAGLRAFVDSAVDVSVVEVGMGGRWDATNVIDATVAVVTNVDLDHQNYLGNTRAEIAGHKAGIVKEGSTLVLGESDVGLHDVFRQQHPARMVVVDRDFGVSDNRVAMGGRVVDIRTPTTVYQDVFLGLHGAHQAVNAAVAVTAVEAFFEQPLGDEVVREALATTRSPGRMEVMARRPLVLIDGAHNVAGIRSLVSSVDEEFGEVPRIIVVGMLEPHQPAEMLAALAGPRPPRMVIACQPDWPRAVPASEISASAQALGIPSVAVPAVDAAIEEALSAAAEDDLVLVTGSLYVVGEAREVLQSDG